MSFKDGAMETIDKLTFLSQLLIKIHGIDDYRKNR